MAELLMLRRVLSTGKKALLVLPYVTLCCEKVKYFTQVTMHCFIRTVL